MASFIAYVKTEEPFSEYEPNHISAGSAADAMVHMAMSCQRRGVQPMAIEVVAV